MRRALGWIAVAALCAASPGAWAGPSVAVGTGKGPKKAALGQVASALKKALGDEGLEVVDAKGKKGKVDRKLAKAVGAAFLVTVDASEAKKKFRASVSVVRVDDGSSVHAETSEPYAGKAGAAEIGQQLAAGVASAIKSAPGGAVVEAPPPPEEPKAPPARVVAPPPAEPRAGAGEPADPEPRAPPPTPKDEAPASKGAAASSGARDMFEVSVGAGSQAATAYTVLVGGAPTALAYSLSPLFLLDVGARVEIPSTALGVEASFLFSPVKFALDTDPPVTPAEPGGAFLDVGGAVGWRFWLSGDGTSREGFSLEPLVGLRFESLSVDPQDRPIVLGASAIVPHFGARAAWGITDALVLGADVRLRLPLGYSESGATTGDGGSGFGLAFGGGVRWWFARAFGLGLNVTYAYTRLSFSGAGTRQLFASDPALVDAAVANSTLRVAAGGLLSF